MTKKLNKQLGLLDVFALCTGAMFSSGFFLLPGIAAQYTGPSVFIAYFFAAFLIIPAMLSVAELATAVPRAGGLYFFIDRSLGPMLGTVGGLGTYISLLLKTAFALVGISAYTAIFFDIPIQTVAIGLTLVFMALNLLGAKKTSGLQKTLVLFLIAVLGIFMVEGGREVIELLSSSNLKAQFTPFTTDGLQGILTTTGFVFVSYLGLTQAASMAEEVKNPERNIPLGMLLSLIVITIIYVVGVFIMVSAIPGDDFINDLTPAWTASINVFKWIPPNIGGGLMVAAAVAAFASTGNGGLLTASRYPLAMARDRILPNSLASINRFGTPTLSTILSSLLIILFIVTLTNEGIAKMASTFQLLIFILLNFAVIVMRSSQIHTYDPGYQSPLYPWVQIFGIFSSFLLIIYMGWGPALFSLGVVGFSFLWYWYYARPNVKREGAIFHWFALLGRNQNPGIENELLHILKEKGLREGDPFDKMIMDAKISLLGKWGTNFDGIVSEAIKSFSQNLGETDKKMLRKELLRESAVDPALSIPKISILYGANEKVKQPLLYVALSQSGVKKPLPKGSERDADTINIFFFLISNPDNPKLLYRLISRLMDIFERENFVDHILNLTNERMIKEYLLHNDRYLSLKIEPHTATREFINKQLKDIKLPHDVLVALIQRKSKIITPRGDTEIKENDIITIIGDPDGVKDLFTKYLHSNKGE